MTSADCLWTTDASRHASTRLVVTVVDVINQDLNWLTTATRVQVRRMVYYSLHFILIQFFATMETSVTETS